jgi:hypothetical protein
MIVGLAVLGSVGVACSSNKPAASGGVKAGFYVGKVSGTDAYIAVATDAKIVAGYLCDGKQLSTWFGHPAVSGGQAALTSRAGASLGSVRFSGTVATGVVSVNGSSHAFSAELATGTAGLYRETSGTKDKPGYKETGWIVLADGSIRGATNFTDPITHFVVQPAGSVPKNQLLITSFVNPIGGI